MKKSMRHLVASILVFGMVVMLSIALAEVDYPTADELYDQNGIVRFNDSLLEREIRSELGIQSGEISKKELAAIESISLDAGQPTRVDLSLLQLCKNLVSIETNHILAENWMVLSECTSLTSIQIRGSSLEDLNFIVPLKKLEMLTIGGCDDISAVEKAKSLRQINFESPITDISALCRCKKLAMIALTDVPEESLVELIDNRRKTLATLTLRDCSLSAEGMAAIVSLKNLGSLQFGNVKCDTITPIYDMASVRNLTLKQIGIETFEGIENMKKLQRLSLEAISDMPDLTPLLALKKLKVIVIRDCGEVQIPEGLTVTQ